MTGAAVQKTILRLSDPKINSAVLLASTPAVAKLIVDSLPGVRRLTKGGPQVAKAVLAWLDTPETVDDQRRSAIGLYILEHYPSEKVKLTLAKYISARRFTGFNSQLAADAFLKAAGIELPPRRDAVAVALREAIKLERNPQSPPTKKKRQAGPRASTRKSFLSD